MCTEIHSKSIIAYQFIISFFVAVSISLGSLIDYSGEIASPYPDNFVSAPSLGTLALFVVTFAASFGVLQLIKIVVSKAQAWATSRQSRRNKCFGADVEPLTQGRHKSVNKDFFCENFDMQVESASGVYARGIRSFQRDATTTLTSFWKSHLLFFFGTLAAIFLCWFVVFLNYYPGTSMNDQLWIISNPIGNSNNHPLLYNVALAGCVRIGSAVLGSANAGFALYVVAQMLFCAAVVAFCATWIRYRGAGKVLAWLVVAFFALVPIVSNYSICAIKDTLFGYVMLLWLPFLYEAVVGSGLSSKFIVLKKSSSCGSESGQDSGFTDSRGASSGSGSSSEFRTQGKSSEACLNPQFWEKRSSYLVFAILIVATALVRNNGLYIGLGLAVVLAIAFRKIAWKKIACAALIALVLSIVPSQILSMMGVQQLFRESVGIPLQQMSAVVCVDEQSLTTEQRSYIDSIIPIESIKGSYAPMAVDTLKYGADFNSGALQNSKAEFFKTYLQLGLAHPDIYTAAFLSQAWGYWDVTAPLGAQSYFFEISDNLYTPELIALQESLGLENNSLYPQGISNWFASWYEPAVAVVPGPAMLFLFLLLATFVIMVAQSWEYATDNRLRKSICDGWLDTCSIGAHKDQKGVSESNTHHSQLDIPRSKAVVKKQSPAVWILLALPWIFLWVTLMISAPISSSLRYVFPMLVTLPFFVALAVVCIKTNTNSVSFGFSNPCGFNKETLEAMNDSANGRSLVGPFESVEDALTALDKG